MDEHKRDHIHYRLIIVLNRPNGYRGKRKQSMQHDAKQHGKRPQGIQIVISGAIQAYEIVEGQKLPSISIAP